MQENNENILPGEGEENLSLGAEQNSENLHGAEPLHEDKSETQSNEESCPTQTQTNNCAKNYANEQISNNPKLLNGQENVIQYQFIPLQNTIEANATHNYNNAIEIQNLAQKNTMAAHIQQNHTVVSNNGTQLVQTNTNESQPIIQNTPTLKKKVEKN